LADEKRLVVVGGNAAGMAAALRARRLNAHAEIAIIEKSRYLAAATCSIPAFLRGDFSSVEALQNITPERAAGDFSLKIYSEHEAQEIDCRNHQLQVANLLTGQSFRIPYDRLILATGADPVRPDLPNHCARGTFVLRSLADAVEFRNYLEREKPRTLVVLGAGTIAQVCASMLKSYDLNVIFIARGKELLEDLDPVISDRIIKKLYENGIQVYFFDTTVHLEASLEQKIRSVEWDGQRIECQALLFALGVRPNTRLAQDAGIESGVAGSIKVDRFLNTSRHGIYACGDCAHTYLRITNKPFFWPLATTSARQGRQAGTNAAGGRGEDPGTLATRIWNCFNLTIGRTGIAPSQAVAQSMKLKRTAVNALSKPVYHGGDHLDLVIYAEEESNRVVGAQIAGTEGVHARLNTLCVAIECKMTLRDLERLDLGYTPEISALWDPVQIAGRLGGKKT
jgi:NADPH-dependent 2,4-dienoyl-CoA reductase/sulfur reductase-like enzyme